MTVPRFTLLPVSLCAVLFFGLLSCQPPAPDHQQQDGLFRLIQPENSGLDFTNTVRNTKDFNIFSYRNFYNGGGVGIGDVNNDGLADVFLTANMDSNRLFINQGNMTFRDATASSGVASASKWSTGVVLVDLNNDGWLDMYVCNAGFIKGEDQRNELFLNNGDGTFTEQAAEWGLDENGYSTHAAFFDYDLDGDLDAYILNNSFIPVSTLNYSNKRSLNAEDWPVKDFLKGGGDKLLRNDGGQFVDVTAEAGIYSSLIGFGLGVTVGDINADGLPDLYISNDFFERDYLYINKGDGTFSEEIKDWMQHLSLSSMGADMADINNDGYPEVFVTDMLPGDEQRLKTTSSFEKYSVYDLKQQRDFYHQYMQNTLQLNNGNGTFSEIACYSGVSATDWSWGALMFDADNDGLRDILVCNGIWQDVTDQDFINFFANDVIQKMAMFGEKEDIDSVINAMPSTPVPNKAFRNSGDLTFQDVTSEWGFSTPSFSNGAAYGDLDNDGDLDLVINNVNQPAFLYQNQASLAPDRHHLSVRLIGPPENIGAIGSKVFVYSDDQIFNTQHIPSRGFQSSIDHTILFGLGASSYVDSVVVVWPDRTVTNLSSIPADTLITVAWEDGGQAFSSLFQPQSQEAMLTKKVSPFGGHFEDGYIDFYTEGLVYRMLSREGPAFAKGDINGDGLEDVFIGGSAGAAGQLYIGKSGTFVPFESQSLSDDAGFEDVAAAFFDADGDGDLDLYVGSGGNHQRPESRMMQDRLYINDGSGGFRASVSALPPFGMNTGVVVPHDFDGDGDTDLFVGSRSVPMVYGISPRSYLLENNGRGLFRDATALVGGDLATPGMITDAVVADVIGDGRGQLIVAGEWMSPQVYAIGSDGLNRVPTTLDSFAGWWNVIHPIDVNGDGMSDLILGNRGENFYFEASSEQPAKLWLSDFDGNGTIEKIMTRQVDGRDMTIAMKDELTSQLVSLKKENLRHADFAGKALQELLPQAAIEKATVKTATCFESVIAINRGNGRFEVVPLPKDMQFSCIRALAEVDIDGDSIPEILAAGNDYGFVPQFSRLDASFGHIVKRQPDGSLSSMPARETGLRLQGVVRHLEVIELLGKPHLIVIYNNREPELYAIP